MKTVNITLKIFATVILVLALTACPDKKKDRAKNYVRNDRSSDWQNSYGYINPQTGQGMQDWGVITNYNGFNGALQAFMAGAEVGYVSGNEYDDTGIRFHGSISSQVYFLVWDEYANQSGQAFYWPMTLAEEPEISGNYARVILQDSIGQVKLEGNINNNGIWQGNVQFYNNNGNSGGTLGNFSIPADVILN